MLAAEIPLGITLKVIELTSEILSVTAGPASRQGCRRDV
jgi:hypothetical protein